MGHFDVTVSVEIIVGVLCLARPAFIVGHRTRRLESGTHDWTKSSGQWKGHDQWLSGFAGQENTESMSRSSWTTDARSDSRGELASVASHARGFSPKRSIRSVADPVSRRCHA